MEVNATFLVQLVHFCITYWALHRFLFKKTLGRIAERKKKQHGLELLIVEKKQSLLIQQKKQHDALAEFQQQYFSLHPVGSRKLQNF